MQTLWKADFYSAIATPLIVGGSVLALIIVLCIKTTKGHTTLIYGACVFGVFITLSFIATTLLSATKDWEYAQNNNTVIEGIIEDYITGNNGSDYFCVNGVEFLCTPIDNNLFAYTYTQRDSKCVLTGNGQYVRITYCTQNGLNGIIKIEASVKGDKKTVDDSLS